MKRLSVLLLALLLCAAASAQDAKVKKGQPAPQFEVGMLDGTTISTADLKGKVVLVNFWATWCPPCRAEFKRIPDEIVKRFEGEDFMLLAISRGEKKETVGKFMKEQGYTFPVGLDLTATIFEKFAESGIPRNFLIDKNGVIVKTSLGYSAGEFDSLVKDIDKLLK